MTVARQDDGAAVAQVRAEASRIELDRVHTDDHHAILGGQVLDRPDRVRIAGPDRHARTSQDVGRVALELDPRAAAGLHRGSPCRRHEIDHRRAGAPEITLDHGRADPGEPDQHDQAEEHHDDERLDQGEPASRSHATVLCWRLHG
jgi:hypothetical protein